VVIVICFAIGYKWKVLMFGFWKLQITHSFSFNKLQEFLVMENKEMKPATMNAFELISLSSGLNLSGLFEEPQVWLETPSISHFQVDQLFISL
jgi:hypothetical protein